MKKLIWILFAVIMLLSACAKPPLYQNTVDFYYCVSELQYSAQSSSIASESRECQHLNTNEDIIRLYLLGPQNSSLRSPFPNDIQLLSMHQNESTIYLLLSTEFSNLNNLELTLSSSCLALTVLQLTGAEKVCISAQGALLNGQQAITMTRESLLLSDTTMNNE